jgi:hypothetical protein
VQYAWAPITKTEKQDDGSIIVHGTAANPAPDRDGQKMDPAWLADAFPKWFAESGNIREQHNVQRAVGRAVGYAQDGDNHMIAAHIVDPVAVTKVEARVLQGFSVGVKAPVVTFGDPAAPMGTIVGGSICETSLVDRMSNPTTLFEIAKADAAGQLHAVDEPHVFTDWEDESLVKADRINAADRRKYAASGVAMPNGDFPIPDADHLKSAIGLLGNYKGSKATAKRHIIKRAKALGKASMLPDDWNVTKADAAAEWAAGVLAAGPDLAKADAIDAPTDDDEQAQIDTANACIAALAKLIQGEAMSLAAGNLNECCDISILLDGISALRYFISREQDGMEARAMTKADEASTATTATTDSSKVDASTEADTSKADADKGAGDAQAAGTAQLEELTKSDGFANAVASAVTKATQPLIEKIEKMSATPVPGGPVLARTATDQLSARERDAAAMRGEAQALLTKADACTDHGLAEGYRERAAALQAKADQ